MKDQAADKHSPIIAGALILTAVFLGVFGWLLSQTGACAEGWWLWDRLACLEPNALGDTFAGAFAPVAFVWLVAAVMLQRNELAAQRQELRESRAVAAQQVEEARKNVQLISEQTAILKEQRVQNKIEINEKKLDEYMELASDIFSRTAGKSILNCTFIGSSQVHTIVSMTQRGGNTVHHYLKTCITRFDNSFKGVGFDKVSSAHVNYTRDLDDVMSALDGIEDLLDKVGEVKKLEVKSLQIDRMRAGYSKFCEFKARFRPDVSG